MGREGRRGKGAAGGERGREEVKSQFPFPDILRRFSRVNSGTNYEKKVLHHVRSQKLSNVKCESYLDG